MEELDALRTQIDDIDARIFELFSLRADISDRIGEVKRADGRRILDPIRERAKILEAQARVPDDLKTQGQILMELLMESSKKRQAARETVLPKMYADIKAARDDAPAYFPDDAFVACQGIEGANSQAAAERFFRRPQISFMSTFEAVFRAVEQGFCNVGVLPIENSAAGSVNKVFDLMMEHDFHIIRTTRIKIDHNLMALPGSTLDGITDVYSHEQAISQCSAFFEEHPGINAHICENTAAAARIVAESGRDDLAALASRPCAELYGLDIILPSVQDRDDNYTRFACIAKDLAIYPGADRTSLMLVLAHEPGSLYKVLAKFYALDINILKLESRPIPGRDFEFMFYFDLECPVHAPAFDTLMQTIGSVVQEIRYLGSYSEIV